MGTECSEMGLFLPRSGPPTSGCMAASWRLLPVEHLAWTSKHLLSPSTARGLAALYLLPRVRSELQSGPRASCSSFLPLIAVTRPHPSLCIPRLPPWGARGSWLPGLRTDSG